MTRTDIQPECRWCDEHDIVYSREALHRPSSRCSRFKGKWINCASPDEHHDPVPYTTEVCPTCGGTGEVGEIPVNDCMR